MSSYIGIDPGNSGGIAAIDEQGAVKLLKTDLSSVTESDIADFLLEIIGDFHDAPDVLCVMEIVGANRSRRKGDVAQGASSMFTFGQNYGTLRGMLAAFGVRRHYVRPQKWQPCFSLTGRKDESTTEKKNRHKAKAQELFPDVKVTLWNADALLLATYCRQNHAQLF
jgi:crossover junction endodeoxyribonuclease RuvC